MNNKKRINPLFLWNKKTIFEEAEYHKIEKSMKKIFEKAGINQTKSCYIRKSKEEFIFVSENFEEEKFKILHSKRVDKKAGEQA